MFITSFPFILVSLISVLVFFGFLERVLERMRLTRMQAVGILLAMFLASFIPDVPLYRGLRINVGGALIPLGIIVYLIWTAEEARERWRALGTILFTVVAVYLLDKFLPLEPGFISFDLDPLYQPAVFAAVFAYAVGRSRRSAFIGAVGGVLLLDVVAWLENVIFFPGVVPIALGGAGVLDTVVVAGVLAVFLAEIVGEIRERIARGNA